MSAPVKPNSRVREYVHLFQDVTRLLTSTLNVDEVLTLILQKVSEVMGVDAVTVRLLDPEGKKLMLVAAHGLSREYLDRGPVDAEKSVTEALSGVPVAIYDATSDPRITYTEAARKEGIKSIVVAPIVYRGAAKGVLRLLTRTQRRYDAQEMEFIAALAEQCGIAIENAKAYEAQQRQLQYFKTLNEIGKALNSTFRLQEILDLIVDRLPSVMDLKGCTLRLLDPAKGHLELMAASGLSRTYLNRGAIDEELSTHHAMTGEPVVILDAPSDHRIRYQQEARIEGVASILAVPVVVKKRIIGVLRLLTSKHRVFSDAEINFAVAVAEQGGIAIQNAILFNRTQDLVTELEQHEEFLQLVMDSMDIDLFVLDKDFRITMANRVFLESHQKEESEVIGRPCHEVVRICDGESHPMRHIKETGKLTSFCHRYREQGRETYLEVTVSPVSLYDTEGDVDFLIVTLHDITDQIRLQEEHLAKEKLEGVVAMAGAMAHELNTPIFSSLGTAQLLMSDMEVSTPEYNEIGTIVSNLKKISALTKKMTRITRFETKDYVGDARIVDIDESIRRPGDED